MKNVIKTILSAIGLFVKMYSNVCMNINLHRILCYAFTARKLFNIIYDIFSCAWHRLLIIRFDQFDVIIQMKLLMRKLHIIYFIN